MTFDLDNLWPRSSLNFTEIQREVWNLKVNQATFEQIQKNLFDSMNSNGHGTKVISTSCLYYCIRRTAMGRSWAPFARTGCPRFLNADEEVQIAQWVNGQTEPPTMTELLRCASEIRQATLYRIAPILECLGCPTIAENLWAEGQEKSRAWGRALCLGLNFRCQCPESIDILRSKFATTQLVKRWFHDMEPHVSDIDPHLFFNFDEIMINATPKAKVITSCDKKAFRRRGEKTPHVTLGLCVSPFGDGPPPAFIFSAKKQVTDFLQFEMTRRMCVLNSANGWMTADLFVKWAVIFVTWLNEFRNQLSSNDKPAVLFLDNCKTHCVERALRTFADHNVKVISFPPHMTHVLQPIDVSCARAFKAALANNLDFFRKHPEYVPEIKHKSQAAKSRAALTAASLASLGHCTLTVCLNGFAHSGLYPWSVEQVLQSRYVHQSDTDPEHMDRMRRPEIFHCGSSVMTSPEFLEALHQWLASRAGAQTENLE
jgi:hypothetical protein